MHAIVCFKRRAPTRDRPGTCPRWRSIRRRRARLDAPPRTPRGLLIHRPKRRRLPTSRRRSAPRFVRTAPRSNSCKAPRRSMNSTSSTCSGKAWWVSSCAPSTGRRVKCAPSKPCPSRKSWSTGRRNTVWRRCARSKSFDTRRSCAITTRHFKIRGRCIWSWRIASATCSTCSIRAVCPGSGKSRSTPHKCCSAWSTFTTPGTCIAT